MTDYSELVKRLRDEWPDMKDAKEAAAAIEAQAKRIADSDDARDWLIERNRTLEARIAKLEAENKTLIKLQEPHYASSEVVPGNQLEHMLYDTITERNELKDRLSELGAALKDSPWANFAIHTNWELKYKQPFYGDDDDQERCWVVFEETGNINDREWEVIGKGDTPENAVQSALKFNLEREQRRAAILASIPEKNDAR